ncbi:MAG: DUF721 domain-containing protein [Candidatus Omnitrophica bacterium]|nr:DUF721 domain-containing protein [Candidatus Omnitrophota bacterium]MDD5351612.1 DUF721 domain-containing protein [Candidatus Omnitrophota bacterium]MDD5550821.1 DUF721 domain-containing protein [Candidatus Omnitrophota bacterium]
MESIKSIINGVIENIKKQQRTQVDIENIWRRCVNKAAAKHTKAVFLKSGRLYINIESPAWLYELKLKKESITKKIQKLSKNKIKEVRFKIGDIHGN